MDENGGAACQPDAHVLKWAMVFPVILVIFIVLPIVELGILMRLSDFMGIGNTLALIVVTGVLGASLARMEGLRVLGAMQRDLAEGRMPAPYLLDGLMILLAGGLLVTPGVLTDLTGFLLLVPGVRALVKEALRRWLERKLRKGSADVTYWEW